MIDKSYPVKSDVGLALASKTANADVIADNPNDDIVLSPFNNDNTNDDTSDVVPKNDKNLLTPNIFNDVVPLTENANKFTNKCDNLLWEKCDVNHVHGLLLFSLLNVKFFIMNLLFLLSWYFHNRYTITLIPMIYCIVTGHLIIIFLISLVISDIIDMIESKWSVTSTFISNDNDWMMIMIIIDCINDKIYSYLELTYVMVYLDYVTYYLKIIVSRYYQISYYCTTIANAK